VVDDYLACDPSASESLCCEQGQGCTRTGICVDSDYPDYSYWRGACSANDWSDGWCASVFAPCDECMSSGFYAKLV